MYYFYINNCIYYLFPSFYSMSKVALIGYEEPQVNGKLNDNQLFVIKETCKLTIRIL